MLCSSSINSIICPSERFTSLSTAFSLSSNSPLNFAPAISAPMSSENMRRSFKPCGTSPFTMRCANPSAIAVLPTPGSPIRTGLFLVFRESILITFRISESRPITGSSFCFLASSTRSCAYLPSASYVPSGESVVTRAPPLIVSSALRNSFFSMWKRLNSVFSASFGLFIRPSIRCSTET